MGKTVTAMNSGTAPYGVLFDGDGKVFDTTTETFTDYDPTDFEDYAITFDPKGGSSTEFWETEFPSNAGLGKYNMSLFSGSSSSEGAGTHLQDMEVRWDGEKFEDPIPDLYHAEVNFNTDSGGDDEYTVSWFKNGVRVDEGISSPKVRAVKRDDGDDKFGGTGEKDLSQIATTGHYKLNVSDPGETIGTGEATIIETTASIGGQQRTFSRLVSRDA